MSPSGVAASSAWARPSSELGSDGAESRHDHSESTARSCQTPLYSNSSVWFDAILGHGIWAGAACARRARTTQTRLMLVGGLFASRVGVLCIAFGVCVSLAVPPNGIPASSQAPGPSIPPPDVPPPDVPLPPSPQDIQPPRVQALSTSGSTDHNIRLRFKIADDSGRAAIILDVWLRQTTVVHRSFPLQDVSAATTYYINWRPQRSGAYRFCVHGRDAAGRLSSGCARVVVKP